MKEEITVEMTVKREGKPELCAEITLTVVDGVIKKATCKQLRSLEEIALSN
jgi:hypothetical protein